MVVVFGGLIMVDGSLVGKVESVADVFDLGKVMVVNNDGDHIEASLRIEESPFGEPNQGGLGNLPLFERGHCELRRTVDGVFPALHLDKDDGSAVSGNNVDLAAYTAVVLFYDGKADPFQEGDGY